MPVRARAIASVWLPPLLLMAVIFFLSAQPNLSSGLGAVDVVARKLVHAGEFALLCWLWWRALRTVGSPRGALGGAVLVAAAYAVTDELHQSFVPTRHASALDVAIDLAGIVAAALVLRRRSAAVRDSEARVTPLAAPPS